MNTKKLREIAKELADKYADNGSHCLVVSLGKGTDPNLEYYCVFGKYSNRVILGAPWGCCNKGKVLDHEVIVVENTQIIGVKNEPSEVISFKDSDLLNEVVSDTDKAVEAYKCRKFGHLFNTGVFVGKCIRCGEFVI